MGEDLAPSLAKMPDAREGEQLLPALLAFEAPFVEEKLLRDGTCRSRQECRKAFAELMKYFWLTSLVGRELPMPSHAVDEVWHQFILFTREYHAFCDRFFGGYVHHHPSPVTTFTAADTARVMDYFRLYQAHFGLLPRIWIDQLTKPDEATLLADTLARESMTPAELP